MSKITKLPMPPSIRAIPQYTWRGWRPRRTPYVTIEELLKFKVGRQLNPHKAMYKVLENAIAKKARFYVPPIGTSYISLETGVNAVASDRAPKRYQVLNKALMSTISEVMCTSQHATPLLGKNIQISKAKVNGAFSLIKVTWIPTGDQEEDKHIQKLLDDFSHPLRTELIQLRILGLVPPIRFLQDKEHAYMAELNRRLKIADYGEGYVPVLRDPNCLATRLRLRTALPVELKEQINAFETAELEEPEEDVSLPPMRMDVFGLDYQKILNTVKDSMRKGPKIGLLETESFDKDKLSMIPYKIVGEEWDKDGFKRFIKERKIRNKKMAKTLARIWFEQANASFNYVNVKDDEEIDDLYENFVKYVFPDTFTAEDEVTEDRIECIN